MRSAEYAYIIVGSGVAGSAVATKLLEADPETPILMLEAGPVVAMKDRRYWWDYVLNWREPYAQCHDLQGDTECVGATPWVSTGSRAIIYGGSTVHWGGWSMRFKREDFQLKTHTGRGGDWPYGYDTLEPYYCRAEEYLSVAGDDNDPPRSKPYPMPPYPYRESDGEMIEAFERLRISYAPMPLARYRKCMATGTCKYCPFGARFSGSFVLDDLLSNPAYTNLDYIGNAPVTRLVAEESRSRITKVEYRDPTTGELTLAWGKRIILCAGAYEVPKILMSSVSRHWKHGIGNDNDLVGRYPVSHLFLSARGTKPSNPERWIQEYDFPSLMSRHYDTRDQQPNGKIFMMKDASLPNVDIASLMIKGKSRKEIDEIVSGPRQVQLSAFMEEFGQYRNRFTVGEGTTRFGLPRTRIDFTQSDDFERRAKNNLKLMADVIKEMGYDDIVTNIGAQNGHHTSSTARMGKDPEEAVVDEDLLVFGTDNVYVCSNAALPNCAAVNPTSTLVAITLKLTDHLLATQ